MKQLNNIIEIATGLIGKRYFSLPIADADATIRERVYCYELYHQMRALWPEDTDLVLSGEVDKAGHEVMRNLGLRAAIPDLLVHGPGYMERNHAIIEVKPANARKVGIQKDLRTLSEFRKLAGYERAIYLFYGGIDVDLVRAIAAEYDGLASIELWLHEAQGHSAQYLGDIE